MKKIVLTAFMAALSLGAYATDGYELPMDKILTGYNSTFDGTTNTITFGNAWVGSGWYWEDNPQDFSSYDYVVVNYSPGVTDMELKVEYSDNTLDYQRLPENGTIKMSLSDEKKSGVVAIYFFSLKNDNEITISDAYVGAIDLTSDVILFSGSCEVSGWDPAVVITRDEFKDAHMQPGNQLVVTATALSENGYLKIMLDEVGSLEVWSAFKGVEGYGNETVPVKTDGSKVIIPLDAATIGTLTASTTNNIRILGGNTTVTKVEIARKSNVTTGMDSIDADAAPVVYYNLQGMRVENPVSGLFIRCQGNKVAKVRL